MKNPEVVLAELESLKGRNNYAQEIEGVNSRLKELDKEQEKLLSWALKGFLEKTIEAENNKINSCRSELLKRKAQLELNIEQAQGAQNRITDIKRACKILSRNLENLNYQEKRLALEALNVRVWADNKDLTLEGALPIAVDSRVSGSKENPGSM